MALYHRASAAPGASAAVLATVGDAYLRAGYTGQASEACQGAIHPRQKTTEARAEALGAMTG